MMDSVIWSGAAQVGPCNGKRYIHWKILVDFIQPDLLMDVDPICMMCSHKYKAIKWVYNLLYYDLPLLIFFSEGFKGAAEKFRIESGIQPAVELDTLDERIKIRDAIQSGRIEEAIQLVNNLHPELLDSDRYLYFHLQVCYLFWVYNTKIL